MSNQTSPSFTKNPELFLLHIRDFCERIQTYLVDKSYEDFTTNQALEDAVYWNLTKIGEAAGRLVDDYGHIDDIPWQEIKGLRNKLVHEYWDINQKKVWEIVTLDIPKLHQALQPLIANVDESKFEIELDD